MYLMSQKIMFSWSQNHIPIKSLRSGPELLEFCWGCNWTVIFLGVIAIFTGWLEEFSRSLSYRNYTFCSKKILLVTSRHSRSLGFQPCIPIFYIHLCTVGHQNFQDQKFEIGLLATQKQIKTYWMTKPYQNNHKKFWLAGFFNTSKNLQNKEKNILNRVQKI